VPYVAAFCWLLLRISVTLFKTLPPVDPVSLVQRLCKDAENGTLPRKSRYAKRLTPMAVTAKATESGLDELCKTVLAKDFHAEDTPSKKFAIRPTLRNHNFLSRDAIIKQIADAVGEKHSVDLKNYDHLILVDIYKSICGMAVVGPEYEKLKRYNIGELWDPTPQQSKEKLDA